MEPGTIEDDGHDKTGFTSLSVSNTADFPSWASVGGQNIDFIGFIWSFYMIKSLLGRNVWFSPSVTG